MKALHLLLLSFALYPSILAEELDQTRLCRLFKKGTKIRMPGSCDQYIVCNGQSGEIFDCEPDLKYDAKQGKCVKNADTKVCDNRCAGAKDGTWVASATDCHGFYYCEGGESYLSSCGQELYFDEQLQMCVYPRQATCKYVNKICELVADKVLFRDESDCSKYFKCEKNEHKEQKCKNQYFNVELGKCVEKKTVPCNTHPLEDVCIKAKKPYVGKVTDGGSCRGYFLCTFKGEFAHDLQPVWLQCPPGKFFSEENQDCLDPREVDCPHNRCDGRGNIVVNGYRNNCRNYIRCENNVEVLEATCADSLFYDELQQSCVPRIIYYKCCDQEKTHPPIDDL